MKTWAVICRSLGAGLGEVHIEPLNDLKPHEHCETCWCLPTLDEDRAWVHHSADGREKKELN